MTGSDGSLRLEAGVGGELPGNGDGMPPGLSPGSRIAGYELEEQIGAGGMAVVFRARDERLERRVALKILIRQGRDEALRNRFLQESKAAAAVDHRHIIPVYQAGEADGVSFIAMRYVEGGDVRSLLRSERPLSAERTAGIVSAVASALDAAHKALLVHRDVKPANILLDVDQDGPDHVYLTDFGISRQTRAAGLTGGEFLGTAEYAAPEQIERATVDGRADQYALACTAFELLSGLLPFPQDTTEAIFWAKTERPPPSLISRRPDLPHAVDGVLAKALAKTPGGRYTTCRDFADALREALGLVAPYPFGVLAAHDSGVPVIKQDDRRQGFPVGEPATRSQDDPSLGATTGELSARQSPPSGTPLPVPPQPGPGPSPRRRRKLLVPLVSVATVMAAAGLAVGVHLATSRSTPSSSLETLPGSILTNGPKPTRTPSKSPAHASIHSSSPAPGSTLLNSPVPQSTSTARTRTRLESPVTGGASSAPATTCQTTNGTSSLSLFQPTISGLAVTINGVVIAPQGTVLTGINWNWGDGITQTGCAYFPETHDYANTGQYTVVVTTTFSDGSELRETETVSVS
jgi:serine/threonine protein kinase